MRIFDSSRVTFGTKLTDRIWRDSNGQLVCRDCIIARTGSYDYLESEIKKNGNPNKIVKVYRTEDEVFNPTSMASFEDKPFVDDHPEGDVTLDNYKELSKGFTRNVRRGEGDLRDCLLCDIVVTDKDTIDEILSKRKRELSLGYDTNIIEKDGKYFMSNIRGNHLALVDDGRAGCATIRDSAGGIKKLGGSKMKKGSRMKLFDDDVFEIEEIKEDEPAVGATEEVVSEEAKPTDAEPTLAEVMAKMTELAGLVGKVLEAVTSKQTDCGTTDCGNPEVMKEGVVGDEDPLDKPEEAPVGEVTEEAKVEEEMQDCDGKLLDADEITETAEEKVEARDQQTYAKFAKVGDSNKGVNAEAVNKAWQERYNRAANK